MVTVNGHSVKDWDRMYNLHKTAQFDFNKTNFAC
jgi:hypothetical protein